MDFITIDFFKDHIHIFIYGITLILSILKYRNYYDSILKFLPLIIGYTFLTEALGSFILRNENFQLVYTDEIYPYNNSLIYNIFDIVFFLYFYFIFWKTTSNQKSKEVIKYGTVVFLLGSLINPFFQNFTTSPQLIGITVGSLILIIAIILYFIDLQKHTSFKTRKHNLLFWIGIGLLVFYPFYPIIMGIGTFNGDLFVSWYLVDIHVPLIILMYCFFIIGFVLMRRRWSNLT